MIVECSGCNTIFPVDPNKVPEGGIHARCSVCSEVFFVSVPEADEGPMELPAAPVGEPAAPVVEEPEVDESPTEEAGFGVEAEQEEAEAGPEPEGTRESESPAEDEHAPTAETEAPYIAEDAEPAFEGADVVIEHPVEPVAGADEAPGFQEPTFGTMDDVGTGVEAPSAAAPLFGKRDPKEKAQRLARVLVSDIILYNPDRHHSATESGRVKEEFEEEIQKSWNEYVEQVGEEVANTTTYFNDALNEILAKGEKIF